MDKTFTAMLVSLEHLRQAMRLDLKDLSMSFPLDNRHTQMLLTDTLNLDVQLSLVVREFVQRPMSVYGNLASNHSMTQMMAQQLHQNQSKMNKRVITRAPQDQALVKADALQSL